MATADKDRLLKNVKIKIKNKEEENSSKSNNKSNLSGSNEVKEGGKNSSKASDEDNKEIIKLNILSQEKEENSKSNSSIKDSKIIKEKSEEMENVNNENLEQDKNESEKKENKKNENNEENEQSDKASSFLDSRKYELKMEDNEEYEDSKENIKDINDYLSRKDPFMTTGKFMQIQPHFTLFSKRIDNLREGIYDNTKKCLMNKSSLQQSENLMRERANTIVKDFMDKLYNLRELFLNYEKEIGNLNKESHRNVLNLQNIQNKTKNDIKDCDHRVNNCERLIGYKLLGKPNYSFMKRTFNITTNK
jgi:hypothetical protein